MNVWSDNIASQGAHEIGSCLLKHTDDFKLPQVKHLMHAATVVGMKQ
jgi:hypothetical protein